MRKEVNSLYFAEELSRRMQERGLKKWYVAYYCEISEFTLNKCLCGERWPNPWQLILMGELMGCSVNSLLGFRCCKNYSTVSENASSIPQAEMKIAGNFWKRVITRMNEINITNYDLANRMKISIYTVNNWLRKSNSIFPKTSQLILIADALECTPSDLLGY